MNDFLSHIAVAAVTAGEDPTRCSDAVREQRWRDAMKAEIDALEENGTWTLAVLPPGKKALGSKWIKPSSWPMAQLNDTRRQD